MGATGALLGAALGKAGEVGKLIESLSKALNEHNPDLAAARAKVSELQQATYELQMENLGLQTQVGKLELEIGKIELKLASDEEWKAQAAQLELVKLPAGGTAYRHHETGLLFCATCYAAQTLIPLQMSDNWASCNKCKGSVHLYP